VAHQQLSAERESSIPAAARSAYDAVVALTDSFCHQHLNAEYEALCRRMAGILARKRPSPLVRGKPEAGAAGIVRAVGWVNFLSDPSQTPHMKTSDIDQGFGISQATGQAKSKAIRDLLQLHPFDTEWTLPSLIEQNPMAWIIQVNGLPVDARHMPREIQEQAYRKGLIPYLPSETPGDPVDVEETEEVSEEEAAAEEHINPTSAADAACLVGELHLSKGEYEKAIQAFTQAIEGNPTADAYEGRAQAYQGLAERDERAALERRLKSDGGKEETA
jgi:tetratricopeptide (TPR) repeat protein